MSCSVKSFGLAYIVLLVVGCGSSGPETGRVEGRVVLDGVPLDRAIVTFLPDAGGRSSVGETDAGGVYELHFSADDAGALLGGHKVQISTSRMIDNEDGGTENLPERVPPRYNRDTELTAQVKAGSNEYNFDLQSGGFKPTAADDDIPD